jgi:hypothetical protein
MKGIHFEGVNKLFGAPKGWDEAKDGPCLTLPTRSSILENGLVMVQSVWQPTADERKALAAGHNLVLTVLGGQPPVMLTVADIAEKMIITRETAPLIELDDEDPDAQ